MSSLKRSGVYDRLLVNKIKKRIYLENLGSCLEVLLPIVITIIRKQINSVSK